MTEASRVPAFAKCQNMRFRPGFLFSFNCRRDDRGTSKLLYLHECQQAYFDQFSLFTRIRTARGGYALDFLADVADDGAIR